MSGPLPRAVAEAANAIALRAEATHRGVSIGKVVIDRARATLDANVKAERGVGLPGRVWGAIPERTRLVLVMLGCEASGEAQRLCRQPWESFSADDQGRMAAAARTLSRDLSASSALY